MSTLRSGNSNPRDEITGICLSFKIRKLREEMMKFLPGKNSSQESMIAASPNETICVIMYGEKEGGRERYHFFMP